MKDPREYKSARAWENDANNQQPHMSGYETAHRDICARLNAKDAEIAALKARIEELEAQGRGGE